MAKNNQNTLSLDSSLQQVLDSQSDDLLAQSRLYWFYGDWESLSELSLEQIEDHPERHHLVLMLASAYQQLNEFDKAEKYTRQALAWGADTKVVAKICLAGAHNIVGRIAALQQDNEKAEKAFLAAVDIGEKKEIELIAHSRAIREMAKLGLIPQATQIIDQHLKTLTEQPTTVKNISAQTKILQTELELLSHELNISLQKNQLYSTNESQGLQQNLEVGPLEFIEALKQKSTSQLGQDLWVLEKTNFKRNGFFVEFGATDGVLLSNSYLLEKEFDWQGICAEPNPKFFEHLKQNRECIVSNECIGSVTGEKVNFVFAQEYGGMQKHMADDMHKDKRQAYLDQGQEMELETISLNDFLIKHNAPKQIDYLSIDTEGSEFEILESFPFDEWDVSLFSIEHNFTPEREKIFTLLSQHGFERTKSKFDDWYKK